MNSQLRSQAKKDLSDDDIEKMVKDAQTFEEEDKKKREEIEIRNNADMAAYSAEKLIKESAEKIDDADKTSIEEAVSALRTALEGEDTVVIKEKMDALQDAVFAVTTKLYQQAAQAAEEGTGAAGTEGADDDTVVDADYEVKKE